MKAWICTVCGYVHQGDIPPENCPICGATSDLLKEKAQTPLPPPVVPVAFRCLNCEYIHPGRTAPERCPVCDAPAERFEPYEPPQKTTSNASDRVEKIVIVGAGIAGLSAAEAIREQSAAAEITMVSNDAEIPYYRLNLTRYLAGEIDDAFLPIKAAAWYEQNRIRLLLREEVCSIDRGGKTVKVKSGTVLPYTKLIVASGAHAFMPPFDGADKTNIVSLRGKEDADRILAAAARSEHCVCIGGGVLGLETAGALARRGLKVTVLEGHEWLLPRQLNRTAGELLEKYASNLGIEFAKAVHVSRFVGDGRAEAVELDNGGRIAGDLFIVTTGVRENTYFARQSELHVDRGIIVNDLLQSNDPDIFAAGDVTQHRGVSYGTWGPAQIQGGIAGANALGRNEAFIGLPRANMLKVLNYDMFSIGTIKADDGSYFALEEKRNGNYYYLLFRDGKLRGSILLGDTSLAAVIKEAIEAQEDFSAVTPESSAEKVLARFQEKLTMTLTVNSKPTNREEAAMSSLKGTKTEQNLLKSFAGESQARTRYTYFASAAKKEGFEQISAIFQETADNEKEHAKRFFTFLEGGCVEITAMYPAGVIGTTVENLKAAAAGENEEYTELYPQFAEVADQEGFPAVAACFRMISRVEAEHEQRYLKLAANIENGTVFQKNDDVRWKCRNCGYVHDGSGAPQKCPACLHPQSYFEIKEINY